MNMHIAHVLGAEGHQDAHLPRVYWLHTTPAESPLCVQVHNLCQILQGRIKAQEWQKVFLICPQYVGTYHNETPLYS
jgi:hypothetical protein